MNEKFPFLPLVSAADEMKLLQLCMANVSAVVIAGILLLSCILDFIFWLTSSKHTTARLVYYCVAKMDERCLQGGDEFKFVSIKSLEDIKLQISIKNEDFCDQQLRVLKEYDDLGNEIISIVKMSYFFGIIRVLHALFIPYLDMRVLFIEISILKTVSVLDVFIYDAYLVYYWFV